MFFTRLKNWFLLPGVRPKPLTRRCLELEQLEARLTPSAVLVTTGNDNGDNVHPLAGSMRAAINAVNSGAADTINFQFAGMNATIPITVKTLPLPEIIQKVTINAAQPNGLTILLRPDATLPGFPNGLSLGATATTNANGSTIEGLVILNFGGDGILLDNVSDVHIGSTDTGGGMTLVKNGNGIHITGANAHDNVVINSLIGTDSSNATNDGNSDDGVKIEDGANHNKIGGLQPGQRNVISGNGIGVEIIDGNDNTIAGNYIGTDGNGTNALANTFDGVRVRGKSDHSVIGAERPALGGVISDPANVIAGNGRDGVAIGDGGPESATNAIVIGNYIGVDKTGAAALKNDADGVDVDGAINTHVGMGAGGTLNHGLGNVISANGHDGVDIAGRSQGTVTRGNIIGRGSLGIPVPGVTLGNGNYGIHYETGTTKNSNQDNIIAKNGKGVQDDGQNKSNDPNSIFDNGYGIVNPSSFGTPVLTSAVLSGSGVDIQGTLVSTPDTVFSLEFFGNPVTYAVGHEQGKDFLGSLTVTTDHAGDAAFQTYFYDAYGADVNVTATSTGVAADGWTSEFSNQQAIVQETYTLLSSSADPSLFGQLVNFTATVGGEGSGTPAPTGMVTFFDGQTMLGAATLLTDQSGTHATFATSALSLGSHNITAVYGGDGSDIGSASAVLVQTVNQAASNVSLSSDNDPSYSGQPVTFTAMIAASDAGAPTGTVTFMDGETVLGAVNLTADMNGQATFTTAALSLGDHSITAVYSGDQADAAGSAAMTQTVQPAPTWTSLSSSADPSVPGQAVTFTALVGSEIGDAPTGTVTFYDGPTALGTASVAEDGTAAFTTSSLSLGSHAITAVYGGDAADAGATSDALIQNVQLVSTETYLSSSADPSAPGAAVTFTATVNGIDAGAPTGTVTFYDGANVLGTAQLDPGTDSTDMQATFTTSALSVGDHTITAVYSGDAADAASTSNALTQTVAPATTWTYLWSDVDLSLLGQAVTLTAEVDGNASGAPTGSVTFMDGTAVLGTATLSAGGAGDLATYTTSTLSVGDHTITAVYSGDAADAASTSDALTQTVDQPTSTSVSSSSGYYNPTSAPGQAVTFTATVYGGYGNVSPGGLVQFYDNGAALGTPVQLTAVYDPMMPGYFQMEAAFTTPDLALGAHVITAQYLGDATFAASTSNALTQTVQLASTSTSLTSSSGYYNPTSAPGQSVTFTATVYGGYGGNPSGTVQFLDNGLALGLPVQLLAVTNPMMPNNAQMQASFTTPDLTLGAHVITAEYQGDATFAASTSSPLTQTVQQVQQISTYTSLSSSSGYYNPTSAPGQSVTFTATVSGGYGNGAPTGAVAFYDNGVLLGTVQLTATGGGMYAQAQAAFTTSSLSLGSNAVTAVYQGDATFGGSSAGVTQTVQQQSSYSWLSSSSGSYWPTSAFGQAVTFTATVYGGYGAPAPTGTVSFYANGALLGTAPVSSTGGMYAQSTAALSTSDLPLGSDAITAVYSGDATYGGSSSSLTQTVQMIYTGTSLYSDLGSAAFGQAVTFTAQVYAGAYTATGYVTFMDGDTVLAVVALGPVSGSTVAQALLTTSALSQGSHTITAEYSGDVGFDPSSSSVLNETIF